MARPQTAFSRLIVPLGKALNGILLVVCGAATVWAIRLFIARRSLPYTATGTYLNPKNSVTYDVQLVGVALGLAMLFGVLTGLLLVSAYRLYVRPRPRQAR